MINPPDGVLRIVSQSAEIGHFGLFVIAPHEMHVGFPVIIGRKNGVQSMIKSKIRQRFIPILVRFRFPAEKAFHFGFLQIHEPHLMMGLNVIGGKGFHRLVGRQGLVEIVGRPLVKGLGRGRVPAIFTSWPGP